MKVLNNLAFNELGERFVSSSHVPSASARLALAFTRSEHWYHAALSYGGINFYQKQRGPSQWQVLDRVAQSIRLLVLVSAWGCSSLSWVDMKARLNRYFLVYEFEIKRPDSFLFSCHGRGASKFHCGDVHRGHIWSLPGAAVQNSLIRC